MCKKKSQLCLRIFLKLPRQHSLSHRNWSEAAKPRISWCWQKCSHPQDGLGCRNRVFPRWSWPEEDVVLTCRGFHVSETGMKIELKGCLTLKLSTKKWLTLTFPSGPTTCRPLSLMRASPFWLMETSTFPLRFSLTDSPWGPFDFGNDVSVWPSSLYTYLSPFSSFNTLLLAAKENNTTISL